MFGLLRKDDVPPKTPTDKKLGLEEDHEYQAGALPTHLVVLEQICDAMQESRRQRVVLITYRVSPRACRWHVSYTPTKDLPSIRRMYQLFWHVCGYKSSKRVLWTRCGQHGVCAGSGFIKSVIPSAWGNSKRSIPCGSRRFSPLYRQVTRHNQIFWFLSYWTS